MFKIMQKNHLKPNLNQTKKKNQVKFKLNNFDSKILVT